MGILSWLAIFSQTLLYNIKEMSETSDLLTWTQVLLPALILVALWLVAVLFIWLQYLRGFYHLHQYQVECLVLYFFAGSAFFLSGYGLLSLLNGQEIFGAVPDMQFATGSAIVGACAFFACLSIAIDIVVRAAIDRMGGERPRTLVRTASGGWDVDWNNSHQNYLLTGDIESAKFSHLVSSGERGCGCCASLELVTRNTLCGFGEGRDTFNERNSDDEETTPLRAASRDNRDRDRI
jgi:hypothetical protein